MPPGLRPVSTPSGPSATARTAAPSVTIENTISDFSAAARGVSAQAMPAAISGAALSRERFQPVTLCPAAIRRGTICAPMAPRPMNPTCNAISLPKLPRRAAHDDLDRQNDMPRWRALPAHHLHQQLGAFKPALLVLHPDRGERGRKPVGQRHVVIAGHRDILRTAQGMTAQRRDGADRAPVVGAD